MGLYRDLSGWSACICISVCMFFVNVVVIAVSLWSGSQSQSQSRSWSYARVNIFNWCDSWEQKQKRKRKYRIMSEMIEWIAPTKNTAKSCENASNGNNARNSLLLVCSVCLFLSQFFFFNWSHSEEGDWQKVHSRVVLAMNLVPMLTLHAVKASTLQQLHGCDTEGKNFCSNSCASLRLRQRMWREVKRVKKRRERVNSKNARNK